MDCSCRDFPRMAPRILRPDCLASGVCTNPPARPRSNRVCAAVSVGRPYVPATLRARLLNVATPLTTATFTMLLLLNPIGPVFTAIITNELSPVTTLPTLSSTATSTGVENEPVGDCRESIEASRSRRLQPRFEAFGTVSYQASPPVGRQCRNLDTFSRTPPIPRNDDSSVTP